MRYLPIPRALGLAALLSVGTGAAVACVSDRSTAGETLTGATCTAPSSTSGATIVFVRSFVFDPATVHVKAGGSIAWVNCEPTNIPHTSTSDAGAWESGSLSPGAAFVRAFPAAGTFAYHCAIHPSMRASVIVD